MLTFCNVDNIHGEKYVEGLLNTYFPLTKPISHVTVIPTSILPGVHT